MKQTITFKGMQLSRVQVLLHRWQYSIIRTLAKQHRTSYSNMLRRVVSQGLGAKIKINVSYKRPNKKESRKELYNG